MSMRTAQNENQVNKLLGKIDLLTEEKLQTMIAQIGDNEESIKKYLERKQNETHSYKKKELQSEEFVAEHPEAQLAVHIFGKKSNVGTAKIELDIINSQQWQEKRLKKVEEFEKIGIVLNREEETK